MTKPSGTGAKILRNSLWYGLETIIETVVFLSASVAVARYLGPEKLGYYSFINFFVVVITRTGGAGLSGATRKYMSEYLGLDQPGMARAVYNLAYRYQMIGVLALTAIGLAGVLLFGNPDYKLVACLLIVSIIPGLMSWIPAQANNAFQDAAKNTSSAFAYLGVYVVVILLTLHFHWDLVGIASATLAGRVVEVILRTISLNKRLRLMPLDTLSEDIQANLRRFCMEAIGLQILMTVVWDRSEVLFLKAYSSLEQIAFYSISYSLTNNLAVIPRILTGATGMTLMVDAARAPEQVDRLVSNACRFLLLAVFPIYLGAAAIAPQAIRVAYGTRYYDSGIVLAIAAILSIPRAFQEIPDVLVRVADKQKQLYVWIVVIGAVNILIDWLLIPRFKAVGAAWGNGLAQALGVAIIWWRARQSYQFHFPVNAALRLGLAGASMAAVSFWISTAIPGLRGIVLAVVVGAPVYILLVRLFGGLEPEDRRRMHMIGNRLPTAARGVFTSIIDFSTPAMPETPLDPDPML